MNLSKWVNKLVTLNQRGQQNGKPDKVTNRELSGNLKKDFEYMKEQFQGASDFFYREIEIHPSYSAYLFYINGLVDLDRQETHIINPLLHKGKKLQSKPTIEQLEEMLSSTQITKGSTFQDIVHQLLSGKSILLIDSVKEALIMDEVSWDHRSVEEPLSESLVYGPREGFNENLNTNVSMLRRRLKTTQLKFESMKLGTLSQTEVIITYLENVAESSIVKEVRSRLERIDMDAIEDSGYIVELIEDHPYSVFPQVLQTERPDRVVGNLLEGKIGIMVENSPFVLVVPYTFFGMMNSPEDYYGRYMITTFIRFLRYLFLLIALLFPAIYIAVTTFHHELLPTNLLFSVAASREQVPFPAVIEALLMEITFEALREAGLRLPKPIGSTVSIVGALVIGEAAVGAGIVSAPLVIVVATTGIASFMFPTYSFSSAIRLLRFLMIFFAGILGFYGILLGVFFVLVHLVQLRSFGVPYLSPIVEFNFNNLKDIVFRAPWWKMDERPSQTAKSNIKRSNNKKRKY